jgi:hypothetical protein
LTGANAAVIDGWLKPPIIDTEVDRKFAFAAERLHRALPGYSFGQQAAANN